MKFDLEKRRVRMSVGDLSDFSLGPRASGGGSAGIWRAQLGMHWHNELRAQVESEGADAEFEVPVEGELARRGWIVSLQGRIDQVVRTQGRTVLREIKTVTRPLPAKRDELLADYPSYFVQAAAYAALRGAGEACELVFVEADSGLAQSVELTRQDEALLALQLDKIAEFLDLTLRARERLRGLRFRPAFAAPREGQESASRDLAEAVMAAQSAVLLQAPTGFGKTGVLIECALGALRDGAFDRVLYLTGKSTGQLHIVETLRGMTAAGPDLGSGASVAAWHVRNKSEHCVNSVFQCVREACAYLDGAEERWPTSGLSRFYLLDGQPRDLGSLRSAGLGARICPYEITRAALTFNDVWIGDYNYVFSPDSRGLFYDRPGFDPARTLVLIDEAHNLPSRAADAHSQAFAADEAQMVAGELRRLKVNAAFVAEWDAWAVFLASLEKTGLIGDEAQAEAREHLGRLAERTHATPVDYAELGPQASGVLWRIPSFAEQLGTHDLPRLWWCPADGTLSITCLDAAKAVGATLGDYGGVVFATATPGPIESFAAACGLPAVLPVRAPTPWRDHAYDVAVDLRVDTSYQQRQRHLPATTGAVEALHRSAGGAIAVFFPSYAYAEAVARGYGPAVIQPKRSDLASQNAWINGAIEEGRALFLVLGSGFAEGIDLMGGRVTHAMVVGPALPEVNAIQKARLAVLADLGRDEAFDRVYRIPGMQKVNQALGRLVRAPAQAARVLLHCRRFAEEGYERLLSPEYRSGRRILEDDDLSAWLS